MAKLASELSLEEVYEFAKALGQIAGAEIKAASERRWRLGSSSSDQIKKNIVDLVTETDVKVEKMVYDAIKAAYPTHAFIGEESAAAGASIELTDAPTWIVDPIDGTTNFVHGFPFCCISIGFAVKKVPSIGVVYNPILDMMYHARIGHGSFRNETRLPLSYPNPFPLRDLGSMVITVVIDQNRTAEVNEKRMKSFSNLLGDPKEVPGAAMIHGLRSIGTGALSLCLVATGELDAFWEIGLWPWDCCAGIVIVSEAGGRIYGCKGRPYDSQVLTGRKIFAIRAIADAESETGKAVQDRLAEEFFKRVLDWVP